MKPAVQINCPSCRNVLRVPPDMVDVSVKCKHCGHILQLKKKSTATAGPPQAAVQPPAATFQQPASAWETLPEYTPPATPTMPQRPLQASAPQLRPIVEELPAAGPSDYNPAFERAGSLHTGRGNYKGPRGSGGAAKWIAVSAVVLLGCGVFAAVLFKPEWFGNKPAVVEKDADKGKIASAGPGPAIPGHPDINGTRPTKAEDQTKPMPRRLLAMNISNYLYANALQYGESRVPQESERRDFYKAVERMADGWRVPKSQRYYVTDGPVEEGRFDYKHPPLKMVVNGTIDSFLNSSRAQDRIVIIFAGHAIEQEGEAYLVPLEGEFEDVPSLIPVKDFYEKLAKCPAQEKLVIFDVCRFDPGRGVERPAFGAMTEGLEKALHTAPAGISVWTSCSKEEFSYEYEYSQVELVGVGKREMFGSIFFSMFFAGDSRVSIFGKRPGGSAGIHHPADPLPVAPVTAWINEKTTAVIKDLERKPQTPKLTVNPRKGEWLVYNGSEPLAAKVELTKPPPTAKREEVVAMFKEMELPAIKAIRKDDGRTIKLADSFPFTEAQVKDFMNDVGPSFEAVAKEPEKFVKTHPIRAATVMAFFEMRKLRQENAADELPEEFKSPISDMTKKQITDKFQRTIAERQTILEEQRDALEAVASKKESEKSKRWLAMYDYATAQVKARYAYIYEYNLAMGNVKTDKLPELAGNQKGWKLSSVKKMVSPKEIRDVAEAAKEGFNEIVTNYPNTPWAVMAKVQKNMAYGLKWEAAGIEAGNDDAMPAAGQ